MYKTFLILILLSWTCKGFCADSTDDALREPRWFQIELLIFTHEKKTADTEFWPLAEFRYPAKMVTIGPSLDELLAPSNLGELNDIIEYRKIIEANAMATPTRNGESEFLFDNRKRSGERRARSSTLDEEDLMSGLNPDIAEFESTASSTRNHSTDIDQAVQDSAESLAIQLHELFNSSMAVDAYRALPKEDLSLRNISQRLQRSPNYRLLYHYGWRQPIVKMEQSVPILVQAGDRFDDYHELDGTVTISLARYLHIDTNLWFTRFLPTYSSEQSAAATQRSMNVLQPYERELISQYPELVRFESRKNSYIPEQTYKLVQSRRMRTAKLHYLDHPSFGLMVMITDFELADE